VEAIMGGRGGKAVGREESRKAEVLGLAGRLADLVAAGDAVTGEMRALAMAIRSALGAGPLGESAQGRAKAGDLVPGGIYVAKGRPQGEFDWEYVGKVDGDPARFRMRREGMGPTVELLGDHGLAPYDAQGKFWHPTNWTEGTGVGAGTARAVAEAAGRDAPDVSFPTEDGDGFPGVGA
jgi:hypothetical protein